MSVCECECVMGVCVSVCECGWVCEGGCVCGCCGGLWMGVLGCTPTSMSGLVSRQESVIQPLAPPSPNSFLVADQSHMKVVMCKAQLQCFRGEGCI